MRSPLFTFRLPPADRERWDAAAAEAGESLSEFVKVAVERRIDETPPVAAFAAEPPFDQEKMPPVAAFAPKGDVIRTDFKQGPRSRHRGRR